jgi:hypothetical protein
MVFTTVSQHDGPIRSLDAHFWDHAQISAKFVFRALICLPAISVALLMALDLLSLFALDAPFRDPPHGPLWHNMESADWTKYAIMTTVALVFEVLLWMMCIFICMNLGGTARVMQQYAELVVKRPGASGGGTA